jgi:hypothetical protein
MTPRANEQAVTAPIGWAFGPVLDQAKRVWARIADILTVNAKVRCASVLYEELSKLSDAELERRGIPRADLPRYILDTLNRR